MSQLYHSEVGHIIPLLCEELTAYRRARKCLDLPETSHPATLFILARSYPNNKFPLRLSINGVEIEPIAPREDSFYRWLDVSIAPDLLVPGENSIVLWSDAAAMNAWSLGIEGGHRAPRSSVSDDFGHNWRHEKMGYLSTMRGEYLVRIRLEEGSDPAPPPLRWEDTTHPRMVQLRQNLPSGVREATTTLDRVQALSTWVSTQWKYRNTSNSIVYAPWDAETIRAWGYAEQGHDGQTPIVMCVHYAVAFVSHCIAAGIPARCAVFTEEINGPNGHFTAEVWFEEWQKWVMVDPTVDAILFDEGVPMSVTEIQQAGSDLTPYVEWGPGNAFQRQNDIIAPWIENVFLPGLCFRHRAIWTRTDFLSHPEESPPGHGSTAYCETGLVWEQEDLADGFAMFSAFGDQEYFNAPPSGFPYSS